MSASLVGSEMCIRDSAWADLRHAAPGAPRSLAGSPTTPSAMEREADAVSYTHLTLPTICSV
eukprot:11789011-Alexandrium_andersonii.AAC.1